jgi:hypothetical protein
MSNKAKKDSALVKSVLALDNYLAELERIGTKINSTDMSRDVDIEFVQKLMTRFAECGEGISQEVANLAANLQEAQARADAVAKGVAKQAEALRARRKEIDEKFEAFRLLGEKARELNTSIGKASVEEVEAQLGALIDELQSLRETARGSRMKALEKNVESLAQSLQAARKKLRDLRD